MSQSLQVLMAHSKSQRDDGLLQVQKAQAHLRQQELQAEQLRVYRAEYQERHPALNGRSSSIDMLRHHQSFMDRLDQAIQQQQQQVQAAQTRLTTRQNEQLALEMRVASVRKLMQRREHAQQQISDRKDQHSTDEMAAGVVRRQLEQALHESAAS
jgi:flagellar protein FliJ